MSERKTEQREREWADAIPDEENTLPEPYEETYRDGSAKHECWDDRERNRQRSVRRRGNGFHDAINPSNDRDD